MTGIPGHLKNVSCHPNGDEHCASWKGKGVMFIQDMARAAHTAYSNPKVDGTVPT